MEKCRLVKHILPLVLAVVLLLCCGCGNKPEAVPEAMQLLEDTPAVELPVQKTVTLMIYMVGSDLEAKAGAATNDLQEIADSGIDLQRCSVVACAGGSPNWHNEVDAGHNTTLVLTNAGFEIRETEASASMGEASCLTAFLSRCVADYPADQYALILWDHGNGPNIGYGKDILFDNDTLTLQEMREALGASPFGQDQKLAWVGFDACLMSSAELACVWAPYADYLAASQEIEPAFGWAYSFLRDLGTADPPSLLTKAAEDYLANCLDYYERKGFDHRDTTLAVLDLSETGKLQNAIHELFSVAQADINKNYDAQVSVRVNTEDIGRISTGSDYDLVDLVDLAKRMEALYPEQSSALIEAARRMIVNNTTNTTRLSGVSLYYPFYNKSYYEQSWAERYQTLGVFPGYNDYLKNYQDIWLDSSMLEQYAERMTPVQLEGYQFVLKLTEEQVKHFASAKYYILIQTGAEKYSRIFQSTDVHLEGNTLYANYDGKVFVAKNNENGNIAYPVVEDLGMNAGRRFYSVQARLSNDALLSEDANAKKHMRVRILFSMDPSSEKLQFVSVQPDAAEYARAGELPDGKQEDVDLRSYTTLKYVQNQMKVLVRDDNGILKAFQDWITDLNYIRRIEYGGFPAKDGAQLYYEYAPGHKYAIVYELQDTQGNVYCSEPITFESKKTGEEQVKESDEAPIRKQWSEKDSLELLSQDGITLCIKKVRKSKGDVEQQLLCLELENRSDFAVNLVNAGFSYNDVVSKNAIHGLFCPPGRIVSMAVEEDSLAGMLDFSATEPNLSDGVAVSSLSIQLSLVKTENEYLTENELGSLETIWSKERFEVRFDEPFTVIDNAGQSNQNEDRSMKTFLGTTVQPQVLLQNDELRVSVRDFAVSNAADEKTEAVFMLEFENLTSDQYLQVGSPLCSVNSLTTSWGNEALQLPPGRKTYLKKTLVTNKHGTSPLIGQYVYLKDQWCEVRAIDQMQSGISVSKDYGFTGISEEIIWTNLKLSKEKRGDTAFPKPKKLLYEGNGVTIGLLGWETDHDTGVFSPVLSIENKSGQDIAVWWDDPQFSGADNVIDGDAILWDNRIGNGQKHITELSFSSFGTEYVPLRSVSFRFVFVSITEDRFLWSSDPITLDFPIPSVLYEQNDVRISFVNWETSPKGRRIPLLLIENNSDQPICMDMMDAQLDGMNLSEDARSSIYWDPCRVFEAGSKTIVDIKYYPNEDAVISDISFRFCILRPSDKERQIECSPDFTGALYEKDGLVITMADWNGNWWTANEYPIPALNVGNHGKTAISIDLQDIAMNASGVKDPIALDDRTISLEAGEEYQVSFAHSWQVESIDRLSFRMTVYTSSDATAVITLPVE